MGLRRQAKRGHAKGCRLTSQFAALAQGILLRMNSLSLDPKITLTVYIVGGVLFLTFLAAMFIYSSRLRTNKAAMKLKGRKPGSVEEGIALATEKGKKF